MVGVAIKLFIKTLILDGGYLTQGDPNKLDAAALADGGWSKSIFRDLVRPVPELAPFCTEALAGGAQS